MRFASNDAAVEKTLAAIVTHVTKEPTRSSGAAASSAQTGSFGRRSRPYAPVGNARPLPMTPCLSHDQSENDNPQFRAPLAGQYGPSVYSPDLGDQLILLTRQKGIFLPCRSRFGTLRCPWTVRRV